MTKTNYITETTANYKSWALRDRKIFQGAIYAFRARNVTTLRAVCIGEEVSRVGDASGGRCGTAPQRGAAGNDDDDVVNTMII